MKRLDYLDGLFVYPVDKGDIYCEYHIIGLDNYCVFVYSDHPRYDASGGDDHAVFSQPLSHLSLPVEGLEVLEPDEK